MSADQRFFNRSAAKDRALICSKLRRAGKFTRVGEDFLNEIEDDLGAFLREVRNKWTSDVHQHVPEGEEHYVTGEFMEKLRAELDAAVARLIQRKVERQPSIGCTLKALR